ncbi:MAG: exosortase C-terminal domain/associated protein EpsI [Bryobacteraceae bacterium]
MSFFRERHAIVLGVCLLAQAALSYKGAPREITAPREPLAALPVAVDGWAMSREFPMEASVQEVLRADDSVSRVYVNNGAEVSLFVAYFSSQRTGQAPHSPKNCLPGAGFEPVASGRMSIDVPGRGRVRVNRYVVVRRDERNLVLYWYQSHGRVLASEYSAKIWLVLDSIRYHRSDTAMVRVMVPVRAQDDAAATDRAAAFVRSMFPKLSAFLPS